MGWKIVVSAAVAAFAAVVFVTVIAVAVVLLVAPLVLAVAAALERLVVAAAVVEPTALPVAEFAVEQLVAAPVDTQLTELLALFVDYNYHVNI